MKKMIQWQTVTFLLAFLIVVGIGMILFRAYSSSKKAFLNPKTTEESKPLKPGITPSLSDSSSVRVPEIRELRPSTPEDYGLPVYYEENKPRTQEDWNLFVEELYHENRGKFEEEGYAEKLGANPYGQFDEVSLEEIKKTVANLDEKISECEEILKNNPDDRDAKKRLENWRKFKALSTAVYGENIDVEK